MAASRLKTKSRIRHVNRNKSGRWNEFPGIHKNIISLLLNWFIL